VSHRSYRSSSALIAALLGALPGTLLAWSGPALGQACCAGGSAVTPARLELHEDYAIGFETHATLITGSFLGTNYLTNQPGSSEIDLEEDLLATARFFGRGQVSLDVPGLATYRADTGISDFGGGLGDINLGARWDFIEASESQHFPGIALLLGVTVPTGRPADAPSASALAANATGIGAFQLTGGVALEKIFGTHVLVDLSGLVSQRLPRTVEIGGQTIQETLGAQLFAIAAVGWVFDSGIAVALSGTFTGELDAVLDGQRVPQSGRSLTTFSLSGSLPINDNWRLQGSVFDEPQISGLGANQPIGTGLTFTVLRTWS
jgi:hypothetical protein